MKINGKTLCGTFFHAENGNIQLVLKSVQYCEGQAFETQ